MRPVTDISEVENFRVEQHGQFGVIRRDSIEPEPIGTLVVKVFRVTGYDRDCDGSLMAKLENIDNEGQRTGWDVSSLGLNPNDTIVVTTANELWDICPQGKE